MIGADVDQQGQPTSFFNGLIDYVYLTPKALYSGEASVLRMKDRKEAIIDLQLNENIGSWHPDASGIKGTCNLDRWMSRLKLLSNLEHVFLPSDYSTRNMCGYDRHHLDGSNCSLPPLWTVEGGHV